MSRLPYANMVSAYALDVKKGQGPGTILSNLDDCSPLLCKEAVCPEEIFEDVFLGGPINCTKRVVKEYQRWPESNGPSQSLFPKC